MPRPIIPTGMSNLPQKEFEVFLQGDTFANINSTWVLYSIPPEVNILNNRELEMELNRIADEMKEISTRKVFIIDSISNMMPNERR